MTDTSDTGSLLYMKTAHGMSLDGFVELTPDGHDTDPDSDALSLADEAALMDLVLPPDVSDDDDGDEDPRYLAYDRCRDRDEDMRAGCW